MHPSLRQLLDGVVKIFGSRTSVPYRNCQHVCDVVERKSARIAGLLSVDDEGESTQRTGGSRQPQHAGQVDPRLGDDLAPEQPLDISTERVAPQTKRHAATLTAP